MAGLPVRAGYTPSEGIAGLDAGIRALYRAPGPLALA